MSFLPQTTSALAFLCQTSLPASPFCDKMACQTQPPPALRPRAPPLTSPQLSLFDIRQLVTLTFTRIRQTPHRRRSVGLKLSTILSSILGASWIAAGRTKQTLSLALARRSTRSRLETKLSKRLAPDALCLAEQSTRTTQERPPFSASRRNAARWLATTCPPPTCPTPALAPLSAPHPLGPPHPIHLQVSHTRLGHARYHQLPKEWTEYRLSLIHISEPTRPY